PAGGKGGAAGVMWAGKRVKEDFVSVGADGLAGVLTTPEGLAAPAGDLVVFLNPGSEPHTGPGRAWVEMARDLACRQVSALRVDMRGWGDSPDGPGGKYALSRPYEPHSVGDARGIVESLCRQGWARVVLAGLCAGGWLAAHLARDTCFGGVLALDVPLHRQLGDPLFPNIRAAWAWRNVDLDEIKREAAAGRWDREDEQGLRNPAGQWLDSLVDNKVPVSLIYSGGNPNFELLASRLARRMEVVQRSGYVRVLEVPEIDHPLHRTWLRPKVTGLLLAEMARWAELA
ncbi:MAG: alpha/beta fold hydrolase, partial [Acidimicrobiales bacterium]